MHIIDGILSSLQTIMSHKFRSFLTLLGIIIGVTSVVAMFSSVNGIKVIIADKMEGMGFNNSLVVTPNTGQTQTRRRGFGMTRGFWWAARRAKPISYRDYEALKAEVDNKYIYGMIESWALTIDNKWLRIKATNDDFFYSKTYVLKEGRFFNHFEMKRAEKVCVVGPDFAKEHFSGENPIDKFITAGNNRYKIIGVLGQDPLKTGGAFNFNDWERDWDLKAVYIPLRTGAVYLRRNMALDTIFLQAEDSEKFIEMKNRTRQVLLANHNMAKDFSFEDIGSYVLNITEEINDVQKKWSITLLAIATISLVVGGIGLFSTLLISINERMTEIGIRKSVGARDRDIFFYFILEALTLSFIAASIGIVFGVLITKGLGMAIKINVPISVMSIYVGFAFSLVIGFLSGLYPAIKAAQINPIQAIYYFD